MRPHPFYPPSPPIILPPDDDEYEDEMTVSMRSLANELAAKCERMIENNIKLRQLVACLRQHADYAMALMLTSTKLVNTVDLTIIVNAQPYAGDIAEVTHRYLCRLQVPHHLAMRYKCGFESFTEGDNCAYYPDPDKIPPRVKIAVIEVPAGYIVAAEEKNSEWRAVYAVPKDELDDVINLIMSQWFDRYLM